MKFQLPIIIAASLTLLIFGGIYFFGKGKTQLGIAVNLESEEFKQLRSDATDAFNAGKYEQAIILYDKALRMRPENAEVYNDLGAVYYEQGLKYAGPSWPSWEKEIRDTSYATAIAELQTALAQVDSGMVTFKTRDDDVASALVEHAKKLGGEVYHARWENEITLNILIGQTRVYLLKARDAYLRALDLKPSHSVAYRNLGSLFMKVGKTDTAIDYYEEAYKLDPRDTELEEYLNQFRK